MNRKVGPTAAQIVLLAAYDLTIAGKEVFSEWDLTVATWKRDRNKFGCRGYEDIYPDHKRVMMEIMSQAKSENPVRQGWLEKVRSNYYRLTSLGYSKAEKMSGTLSDNLGSVRSAQPLYDAIAPFALHPVFRKYLIDPNEPRTWLGAEGFLGLTKYDPIELEDRLRRIRNAAGQAQTWMDETGQEVLRSGVTGGRTAITQVDLKRLPQFVDELEKRFRMQMDAIRRGRR